MKNLSTLENRGPQIGVITSGGGLNHRAMIDEEKAKGRIIVIGTGGAHIHLPGR